MTGKPLWSGEVGHNKSRGNDGSGRLLKKKRRKKEKKKKKKEPYDVCNLWNLRNSTGYIRHKAQAPFVVLHSDQTLSLRYRKRTSTTTTTVFYLFINYYHYLYLRGVGN